MLMLIEDGLYYKLNPDGNFNTSHVNVNLAFCGTKKFRCDKFQYISC